MKRFDFGQTIGILANLGVIVGIAFLVVEIDQNNDALAFQARGELRQFTNNQYSPIVENAGGIADILTKRNRGDELTDTESVRLFYFNVQRMRGLESLYREVQIGALAVEDISIDHWRGILTSSDGQLLKFIERLAGEGDVDSGFFQFINDEILDE